MAVPSTRFGGYMARMDPLSRKLVSMETTITYQHLEMQALL